MVLSGMSRQSSLVATDSVAVVSPAAKVTAAVPSGVACQWLPRRKSPGSSMATPTVRAFVVDPRRVRINSAVSPSSIVGGVSVLSSSPKFGELSTTSMDTALLLSRIST